MSAGVEKSAEYLYARVRSFCSYQERSVQEVRKKLLEWKVRPEVAAKIIRTLGEENYLNEERFARMFAGGKFRMRKWGRNRIMAELRARQIPELTIQIGLEEIDEHEYIKTLQMLIDKKKSSIDHPDSASGRNKIYNFVLSKGFERHLILKYL